jgi:thymidine kinase
MFLENLKADSPRRGWIEVICGSMFSGKTEELIRRLKRAKIAKQNVEIFKPHIDIRYHAANVVSHDSNYIHSTPVKSSTQILSLTKTVEVVGIDESQFFDDKLPAVCDELAARGVRVIAAGLDMDYLGKPFGPLPQLMAIAEYVTKVHAICIKCGSLANHSHRTVDNSARILVGEQESYIPLCRRCFVEEREKNKTQVTQVAN